MTDDGHIFDEEQEKTMMRGTITNVNEAHRRPRGRPRRLESNGHSEAEAGAAAAGAGMSRFVPGAREGSLRGTVFEDDVMLPEQYFARLCHRADYPGEQRLLLAILEDAVHCFQTNLSARTPRRRHMFEEADEWLFADTCEASVTFDYVCDVFDLDQECIRAGLQRWRQKQLDKQRGLALPARTAVREREQEPLPVLAQAVGA